MNAQVPGPEQPTGRSGELGRAWLYLLALVFLGVLVAPFACKHPAISRREKLLIIGLGGLQTLAAIVVAVLFCAWLAGWLRRQLELGG